MIIIILITDYNNLYSCEIIPRGCMNLSMQKSCFFVNPYFPLVSGESQNYLNSKAFTTSVAAAETSLVAAVATKWQQVYLEADRYPLPTPSIFCHRRASKQCHCLFWFYWLVHAISHQITDCMFLSFICSFALTSKTLVVFMVSDKKFWSFYSCKTNQLSQINGMQMMYTHDLQQIFCFFVCKAQL